MNGGERVAAFLQAQSVEFVFTLVGGHISPILVACKRSGLRVIDTRLEATAVFAADAVARLSGRPGVAIVTAGPGVANTLTAVKNAQLAHSPLLLLGGAAPTLLRGRGALQEMDGVALLQPVVKKAWRVSRLRDLASTLAQAWRLAQEGVPGPVFVELPVDLLYDRETVRSWYGVDKATRSLGGWLRRSAIRRHLRNLLDAAPPDDARIAAVTPAEIDESTVRAALQALEEARRPLLLVGGDALLAAELAPRVAASVERLGVPVYLTGAARGLLGAESSAQLRHKRRDALREADVVILAGVPCDFRLDYGRHLRADATVISIQRDRSDLRRNRRPAIALHGDPGRFLIRLADLFPTRERWVDWRGALRGRDDARSAEIRRQAFERTDGVNPLRLCQVVDSLLDPDSVVVADGGDFVATASYVLRPRGPLSWLDPGPFGTLGVGAGFALGAALLRPEADIWVLFGDGALGYSLIEFDTFKRHGVSPVAIVGNDAAWSQIARDQIAVLGDDVATQLVTNDYHLAARGLGAAGILVTEDDQIGDRLREAQVWAAQGQPVLVNALLGESDFRKGSISI